MSKNNPSGDKGSFLGLLRRPLDKAKRLVRSSSRLPSGQSVSNAEGQPLRPSSSAGVTCDPANNNSHLLAPSPLGTHMRAASAPDLAGGAISPPSPIDDHTSFEDNKANIHDEDTAKWGPAWLGLKTTLGGLHETAKLFPALHSAVGLFLSCFELFQAAAKNRQDYDRLASDLEALIALLDRHLRDSGSTMLSDSVTNIVMSLKVELGKASQNSKQNTATGVVRARENEDALMESYQQINNMFRYLQIDASLSTWSIAHEHLAKTRLENTQPAKLASYDAALPAGIVRRTCTESTRTAILLELDEWSCDPSKPQVYWMNGMAGTGKTTISCSLCENLAKRKQLGASFFSTRTLPECRDARVIIPTIAYQLAQYSGPFKSALCKVLENDSDVRTRKIQVQFERMLKGPLLEVQGAIPGNVVVVIDALDECDNGTHVREILSELFRLALDLPLKFFLTSRPEPGIANPIMSQNDGTRAVLHLHEIETSLVQADVELYLKEGLSSISPSASEIQQLADLAGCLFIYAATAVRYILPIESNAPVNSRQRLKNIVAGTSGSTKQHAELDALYVTILKSVLNESLLEPGEYERGREIIWTAVSVCEPVTTKTLSRIADVGTEETETILQSLQSVLRVSRDIGLVSMLHASFPDFINNPDRLQQFSRGYEHTQYLAMRCFSIMKAELKLNICELESSFALDESIRGLDQRVAAHISQPLSYACRYWGDHLTFDNLSGDLSTTLQEFLSCRLLFWMEVLNLIGSGMLGIATLHNVQQWLLVQGISSYLTQLIYDAKLFLADFAQYPVAKSTPHIYVSALPFCHKSSLVYSLYQEHMRGLTKMGGTALDRGLGRDAKWSTGVTIQSVSASPIGSLVAFGAHNNENHGMIGVLDYHTGAYRLPIFQGHREPITSVAFSPDGSCIASASEDQSICLWSASSAKSLSRTFGGHTDAVSSVVFSPDGTLLISGSHDRTVRVWSSQNGQPAINPLEGHTDVVSCVAVSPDGTRVVSGSHDCTIRVWSITDGTLCFGPFQIDDRYWVRSVAFSSDGLHVAVGFNGGLSMWNLQKGNQVPGFGQEHNDRAVSVVFSPEYNRIISSSDTSSRVCMWDSQTGALVSQVDAHTGVVNCVKFSPNGAYILSGSEDGTICVWSAHGFSSGTNTSQGVPSPVSCVTFTADGSHFASGSHDGSVCVWDIHDGGLLVGPLKGHGANVKAVAYSPDQSHIVSAANDGSLFTWSAQNGSVVSGPVQGPVPKGVWSMAISPDVTRVVSGFRSGAICVWGVADGKIVVDSFEGHSNWVLSLAFSPDGTRIVSGSSDRTVCVWDAHTGARTAGPLTAHPGDVNCVSFSPDGLRIASGSDDRTICVHNADDGKLVAGPFSGHSDYVMFVAFSPDGTHIVSGSYGGEVCVWNAHSGEQVAGPFTGASISWVAFSPDGRHIVCCRYDRSVRFIPISPSPPSASVPALHGELKVDESGWLVDQQGQHLLWVPPHFRPFFPSFYGSLAIGSDGTIQVDYRGILVGDEWAKCYVG